MNIPPTHSVRDHEDQGCRFRRIKNGGVRVVFEVTGRCNLRCQHCFACSDPGGLDPVQALEIIAQLPEIQARKIILTGGEPLLRPDIETMIGAASSLGMGVDLNSNLSPFTPGRAARLWAAGLREISTSIDGLQEYHDWLRQSQGDFRRVIAGIRLAIGMGFTVDVHGVCTPGNLAQVEPVIDLCAQLGVASTTLLAVVALGQGAAGLSGRQFSLQPPDRLLLREILLKKRQEFAQRLPIRTIDIFRQPTCAECAMAVGVVGITPAGKLVPCLLARYTPGGEEDLTRYRLRDAWQAVRNRVEIQGRYLGCSNAAYDDAVRTAGLRK